MRTREEILKENEDIMSKSTTTGNRNSDDMRRLASNNIELMALLQKDTADFKDYVERYGRETNEKIERYAREADRIVASNHRIAILSIVMSSVVGVATMIIGILSLCH